MINAFQIQEILDRVIDFLWDDKSALHACSIVASTWTDATQHHIWETININRIPRAEKLVGLAGHCRNRAALIQELVYDAGDLPMGEDRYILEEVFPMLKGRLTRLKKVVIIHSIWRRLSDEKMILFVTPFENISALELRRELFVSKPSTLFTAVARFPWLRHLSLVNTGLYNHGTTDMMPNLCLSSLAIHDVGSPEVVARHLVASQSNRHIRLLSIDLKTLQYQEWQSVWQLLGDSVTNLRVNVVHTASVWNPDEMEAADLRFCNCIAPTSPLVSLSVSAKTPRLIFRCIQDLHILNLRHLSLEATGVVLSSGAQSGLTHGPDVLDHSKLPSLEAVDLILLVAPGSVSKNEAVARFSRAEALGIFHPKIRFFQPVVIPAKKKRLRAMPR